MPTRPVAINLIGEEAMDHSPVGRIVSWAVTYGRYIMIGTEIVVLLAFISRFSLDRKLTDLNDELSQKQAIIEANQSFESDFRNVQDTIQKIQTILAQPPVFTSTMTSLESLLPSDTHLTTLDISQQKLSAGAISGSSFGFTQFIANLQASPLFKNVELGDVHRDPLTGIQFQFTANLAKK